jgi:hypothetical protein
MRVRTKLSAGVAALALAVPAAAVANPSGTYTQGGNGNGGSHGHKNGHHKNHKGGQKHNPVVMYVFKGTYSGSSVYTPSSTVHILHGNRAVKRAGLIGQDVQFDLTTSRVVVADTNGDGARNLTDVAAGDRVVVKARLRKRDPGAQPFTAKQLVDQTHPAPAG